MGDRPERGPVGDRTASVPPPTGLPVEGDRDMDGRRVLYVALATLVLAAHVLLLTVGLARAAVWLGGATAAGLLLALVAAHVEGARRLAARRRGEAPAGDRADVDGP